MKNHPLLLSFTFCFTAHFSFGQKPELVLPIGHTGSVINASPNFISSVETTSPLFYMQWRDFMELSSKEYVPEGNAINDKCLCARDSTGEVTVKGQYEFPFFRDTTCREVDKGKSGKKNESPGNCSKRCQ